MEPIWAEAGDTFFTRSESLLGRLIRWVETDPGETNGTWANHAGVVVEAGWIGPGQAPQAVVVEALWKTRKGPWENYKDGAEIRVFRPIPPYTPIELAFFKVAALKFVGDTYGWWKLGFHLLDRAIFRGKKVLSHLMFIDKRPICSYLAAKVNQAARPIGATAPTNVFFKGVAVPSDWFGFGMDPETADPDEMMDFCLAHPELWKEIK